MKADERGTLEDFNWDDEFEDEIATAVVEKDDTDIFSEENWSKPLEEEEAEEEEGPEEEEVEEEDLEEETEETDEETDEVEVDENKLFSSVAADLAEMGFNLNLEEGEELDASSFVEKAHGFINESVEGAIGAWMEGMPEEAKKYNKFIQTGGTPEDYYKTLGVTTWRNIDTSTEAGSEQMVRYYLEHIEGADKDFINDEIADLQDSDRIHKKAEYYEKRLDERDRGERDRILEQREQAQREAQDREQRRVEQLRKAAGQIKEVNGMPIDSKKSFDYLTKATVKEGDNYVSPFFGRLKEIIAGEPDKLLLLSEVMRTDFDFGAVERRTETRVAQKTKDLLKKSKNKSGKTRTGARGEIPVWEVGEF